MKLNTVVALITLIAAIAPAHAGTHMVSSTIGTPAPERAYYLLIGSALVAVAKMGRRNRSMVR